MANNIEKQLKEISERLEQGVKEIFTSERYTEYLNTMSKFHNYSFNNTLLITMQKPEATLVAGYQAWQKKFNRQVKRGEKGIQIIAPAPFKEKQEIEKTDPETADRIHKPSILERLKQEKAQQNTAEQTVTQKSAKKKHEQEL